MPPVVTESDPDVDHGRRRARRYRLCAAAALSALLTLTACGADDDGGPGGEESTAPFDGPRGEVTTVAASELPDVSETSTEFSEHGIDVQVTYPEVPGGEDLGDALVEAATEHAGDFALDDADARSVTATGTLTAISSEVVGVRLVTEEESGDHTRTCVETLWYDPDTGHVAASSELVSNYEALSLLADAAREDAATDEGGNVAADRVYALAHLFDAIGFNAGGDVVVEFDQGQVADARDGLARVVVDAADAGPWLSQLGRSAQEAATDPAEDAEIPAPPEQQPDLREAPGVIPPRDDTVDCDEESTRCVALTFDDGPGGRTPELLDLFAEYDAKATFFITGEPARMHRDSVRRIYAEGHELANHTVNHAELPSLSEAGVREETAPLQALVRRETGYTPHLMRPPYGATNAEVNRMMGEAGMAVILWDVDTLDWKDRDSSVVADRAVNGTSPGSIVLFHDIHDTTIDALPRVLQELDDQGYTFVTVTELLGDPEPGEVYISADEHGGEGF